jgi:hypothetical protein
MPSESIASSSRRSLLAAAAGGLIALVAQALGRAAPVRAADGEAVLVGGEYTGTSVTKITNTTNSSTVLQGDSTDGVGVVGTSVNLTGVWGQSGSEVGVFGSSPFKGVYGSSSSGTGVHAQSSSSTALHAESSAGNAIFALSFSTSQPAAYIKSEASRAGVFGFSGNFSDAPPTPRTKTGLHGYAAQDANARGVVGQTTLGQGVRGEATTGTGGYFRSTSGTALQTAGPVKFSSAGLATIPSGSRSVTVTPGMDITALSKVLATLQSNPGGTTAIQRVARNTTANTFTIWLTASATANTTVAWFVIS